MVATIATLKFSILGKKWTFGNVNSDRVDDDDDNYNDDDNNDDDGDYDDGMMMMMA